MTGVPGRDRRPNYASPSLAVWHHAVDFAEDPRFAAAYKAGMATAIEFLARRGAPPDIRHEWPVAVACWAGQHASHLPGAYVECGTNTGILAKAICEYVDFNALNKDFYLFDTYCGIPSEQISQSERAAGRGDLNARAYAECYEATRRSFAMYPRVHLVRGIVPTTLPTVSIERVCYLSLDMNIVYPEIAALEYFWDKLSSSAPVLIDDYGKTEFIEQRRAMNAFAVKKGVAILDLPTGQGLLLKP